MIWNNTHIKQFVIILMLILGFIISPGCLEEDEKTTYEYKIQVSEYTGTGNYTLYLPFPIDSEGHNSNIFDNIKNKANNAEFKIINSSKGICLKLTYYDDFSIELEDDLNNFNYEPSMYNYSEKTGEENYWVYSNSSDTIYIKMYFEKYSSLGSTSRKTYTVEGYLEKGWQMVDAETENEEG